jgi:ABC-type sugar transport system substrate-binding protein
MAEVLRQWPGVQIVAQSTGDWTRDSGRRLAEEWLRTGQPIDAIFAANDPMALGVVDAVEALNLTGSIAVVGFDGLPEALRAINSGAMLATVNQDPLCIGQQAVDTALQALDYSGVVNADHPNRRAHPRRAVDRRYRQCARCANNPDHS